MGTKTATETGSHFHPSSQAGPFLKQRSTEQVAWAPAPRDAASRRLLHASPLPPEAQQQHQLNGSSSDDEGPWQWLWEES